MWELAIRFRRYGSPAGRGGINGCFNKIFWVQGLASFLFQKEYVQEGKIFFSIRFKNGFIGRVYIDHIFCCSCSAPSAPFTLPHPLHHINDDDTEYEMWQITYRMENTATERILSTWGRMVEMGWWA